MPWNLNIGRPRWDDFEIYPRGALLLGALLGIVVFLFIHKLYILDPTFIAWTMKGDAGQHFLGWHFFRGESWHWPLGFIQNFQYPQGTSIVYTDSIPLIALPLKLLAFALPKYFQYHGLWLLLCYALQGVFACLLLRRITSNSVLLGLGSLLFLLSPVMEQHSGVHQ